jgi:hypothetical protein
MGKLRLIRSGLLVLVLASSVAIAPVARAQSADASATATAETLAEARTHYAKGTQFLNEGSYELAQAELLRAYQLAPNYKILYNIALCAVQLQDFAGAYRTFEQYLNEGGTALGSSRRQEVEKQLEFLKARTATLELATNVVDADVLVDDVPVGKSPLPKALLVNAGRRKLSLVKRGRLLATRMLMLAGGESLKASVDVDEAEVVRPTGTAAGADASGAATEHATEAPRPGSAPDRTPASPQRKSFPWVSWAATGVLAAGAATFAVLSVGASNDLRDQKSTPNPNPEDLRRLDSRAGTYALVTDALTGAALVASGVSLYLTLRSPRADDGKPSARRTTNVALSPTGVSLRGTF